MSDTLGQFALDAIHNVDALALLKGLPDGSVDIVVTSPPYNLRNSTGNGLKAQNNKGLWTNQPMRHGYGGEYSDDLPNDVYIAWQRECLDEMMRVLKPTGAIFYNHKWRVQDGLLQRLADEITAIEPALPVRQIIIWKRSGGINFNKQYFLPSYEVIYLIAKPGFELQPGGNAYMDAWDIRPSENKKHPNSFPALLVERCLLAASSSGDIVLDPFAGIGTVATVARALGRHSIGCDINAGYVAEANRALAHRYTPYMFTEAHS